MLNVNFDDVSSSSSGNHTPLFHFVPLPSNNNDNLINNMNARRRLRDAGLNDETIGLFGGLSLRPK